MQDFLANKKLSAVPYSSQQEVTRTQRMAACVNRKQQHMQMIIWGGLWQESA